MPSIYLPLLILSVFASVAVNTVPDAHALASSEAEASSFFTIMGFTDADGQALPARPMDLSIFGDGGALPTGREEHPGDAEASAGGSGSGDASGLFVAAGASSFATNTGPEQMGAAEATKGAVGFLNIENRSSSEGFFVTFAFGADVSAASRVDQQGIESANASAGASGQMSSLGSLFSLSVDAPPNASLAEKGEGSLFVGPGDFTDVTIDAGVGAYASADPLPVPEPGTFLLLGAGLFILLRPKNYRCTLSR